MKILQLGMAVLLVSNGAGQTPGKLLNKIDKQVDKIEQKVIEWRRDFHENPELSNREFRTANLVAEHLRSLGLDVKTGVAHTGVVGLLKGGKPGPVVALRADMDGLPVTEKVDLFFASKAKGEYQGKAVGVMHACGHDNHVATLMGVAEILSGMKQDLPGTVKFIFQPAEEGPPPGEDGGAKMMVDEGVMTNPDVDAIFGLHAWTGKVGTMKFRPGPIMAASDRLEIVVRGYQTHGARPWDGVDPIVVSAQIVQGLQTIVSRQIDITKVPAVVTIGSIHGGIRFNIIPEEVRLEGTIRTFDMDMRTSIHERIQRTAIKIAESAGATAVVSIYEGTIVTHNDENLTVDMLSTLERVYGKENIQITDLITGAEDFSYFQQEAPGFYFFNGVVPRDKDPKTAPPNHSPYFFADEENLKYGMRALAGLAVDYLFMKKK